MAGVEDAAPERRRDQLKEVAKKAVEVPIAVRTSDLPKRAASALVMLMVAGGALWLGGVALQFFVVVVALATAGEFIRLVWKATAHPGKRTVSIAFGLAYIAGAAVSLLMGGALTLVVVVGSVIFVDTFAYFAGRTFGGPKIAPRISPSKTWSGLIGGAIGASIFLVAIFQGWPAFECWRFEQLSESQQSAFDGACSHVRWAFNLRQVAMILFAGFIVAVIAQSGDFFESWLKRKAGVKDSSNLIPGHGGVFDRTDGLIAVSFVAGILTMATS